MTSAQFLEKVIRDCEAHIARMKAAVDPASDEAINFRPGGLWSPIQVVEHLNLANAPYLEKMSAAIATGVSGNTQPRQTGFGKWLAKMSGPTRNAPTPKFLRPSKNPPHSEYDKWVAQMNTLIHIARNAEGVDLVRTRIKNPFIKFMSMNLTDCFTIGSAHTERHIAQIEERVNAVTLHSLSSRAN